VPDFIDCPQYYLILSLTLIQSISVNAKYVQFIFEKNEPWCLLLLQCCHLPYCDCSRWCLLCMTCKKYVAKCLKNELMFLLWIWNFCVFFFDIQSIQQTMNVIQFFPVLLQNLFSNTLCLVSSIYKVTSVLVCSPFWRWQKLWKGEKKGTIGHNGGMNIWLNFTQFINTEQEFYNYECWINKHQS